MRSLKVSLAVAITATLAVAQRPANTPICDYYTTVLLKDNNATNQLTLLTLVVNTAVIGNYTKPNVGIAVPGILAKGTFNGTAVNLLPFFDGTLLSTNGGGNSGISTNFLDDGGAAPLKLNKPANGTSSAQYLLLTHLYEYFGLLLGCTMVGSTGYPAYGGDTSMYNVHKYMKLSTAEVGYFITQVGLSAASFGVATEDVTAVGQALAKLFGSKCEPPAMIIPNTQPELQSICTADDCPLSANATCAAYANVTQPTSTAGTSANKTSGGTPSSTSSKSMGVSQVGGASEFIVLGLGAAIGVIALAFSL